MIEKGFFDLKTLSNVLTEYFKTVEDRTERNFHTPCIACDVAELRDSVRCEGKVC